MFFLGQHQCAYGFPNFSIILCLKYAWNSRICLKVGTLTFVFDAPEFYVISFWGICQKDIKQIQFF